MSGCVFIRQRAPRLSLASSAQVLEPPHHPVGTGLAVPHLLSAIMQRGRDHSPACQPQSRC